MGHNEIMPETAKGSDATSSYPETADIETSSDDYAGRFAGHSGQWMLEVQEKITSSMLPPASDIRILDVGGGHGQLAIPLCRKGFHISILASAESCRKRVISIVDEGKCDFVVGNVLKLPFPDRSFHTVLCFRLLTHCTAWPQLVAELCRVSDKSVIVDYPTSQSLNAIAPMLFGAKKRIEKNTRKWRLFRHQEVLKAFADNSFTPSARKAQFLLPMVLHRALKCRTLSSAIEGLVRLLGLTNLWGSPVILRFNRETGAN
jgi:2-polyprenyl-3-methyl-5-hydroxy-6-metoxy-1,4-benzoquinol methylase